MRRDVSADDAASVRATQRRSRWDSVLQRQLETLRLVFMPLVNPGGPLRGSRANPNGVRSDAQRAARRQRSGALADRWAAHHPEPALVSRAARYSHGNREPGLVRPGRRGTAGPAVQHRARLPLRLRHGRPHLVPVCTHRAADLASARGARAERDLRRQPCPPPRWAGAAEPPVPDPWRPVGSPLPARLRNARAHLPAADCRRIEDSFGHSSRRHLSPIFRTAA